MGITQKIYDNLKKTGIDIVTMGNHTWGKKDIFSFIDHPRLLRPANYSSNNPGRGYGIYDCNIGNTRNNVNSNIITNNIVNGDIKLKKIAVINLIGRVTMNVLSENPFLVAKKICPKL